MSRLSFRALLKKQYQKAMQRNQRLTQGSDFARSAVVFSPHFDDETLGCGGTILKKRKAGAALQMVFMTDGSKSHSHRIFEEALREMRTNEGRAAAAALGLNANDVTCLGFEETRLADHKDAAIGAVVKILQSHQPEEIYFPYRREPWLWSDDHLVTTDIVLEAVKCCNRNVMLYEYPIWFWFQWPWVSLPLQRHGNTRTILKNTLANKFGYAALKELRWATDISDVLDQKREALNQHKSQVFRLETDSDWPILQDVANGEFLDCFFQPVEYFYRTEYAGDQITPGGNLK